jgi:molecular chaperone HscB
VMNYFDFFDTPVSFAVDEAALRRKYYANSKKYHPDFYTLESEEKQAEILELSTLNNQAYNTLADFDKRMKYILDLKDVLEEEGKNQIPQDFLMEMMEINEKLMELEFDFDADTYRSVQQELEQQKAAIYREIAPIVENYDDKKATDEELKKVKDYYLKKRYLLRIQENLSKFAIR